MTTDSVSSPPITLGHRRLIPASRPDRLALASWWHGGPLPPVDEYHFVQLGAGDGTNLLPLAFHHPAARFTGLEKSGPGLTRGREDLAALGLSNLELLDVGGNTPPALASMADYLLIDGQTPTLAADRWRALLRWAHANLNPRGIACLGFGVREGRNARNTLGDPLRRLARDLTEDAQRVRAGRLFSQQLLRALPDSVSNFHVATMGLVVRELERAATISDQSFLDDYMTEAPGLTLGELVAAAEAEDLRYLGDATYCEAAEVELTGVRAALEPLGLGTTAIEEALDMLSGRPVRYSLLCRSDFEIPPALVPAAISGLKVAGHGVPVTDRPELAAGSEETFVLNDGRRATSDDPVLKASLLLLAQRAPHGVVVRELADEATALLRERGLMAAEGRLDLKSFAQALRDLHSQGIVELRLVEPKPPTRARLVLHDLAQLELRTRGQCTSRYHSPVAMDAFATTVATLLADGDENHDHLVRDLVAAAATGELDIQLHGVALRDENRLEPVVRELLVHTLNGLQRAGICEAAPPIGEDS